MLQKLQKVLTLLVVVGVLLGALPIAAYAEEIANLTSDASSDHTHTEGETNAGSTVVDDAAFLSAFAEDNPVWDAFADMNTILVRYLGTNEATEADIQAAVLAMDAETMAAAQADLAAIDAQVAALGESEQTALAKTDARSQLNTLSATLAAATIPVSELSEEAQDSTLVEFSDGVNVAAAGPTLLAAETDLYSSISLSASGVNTSSYTSYSGSISADGSYSFYATSTSYQTGTIIKRTAYSSNTTTVTMKNNLSETVKISFSYAASNHDTVGFSGNSGSFTTFLSAGDSTVRSVMH